MEIKKSEIDLIQHQLEKLSIAKEKLLSLVSELEPSAKLARLIFAIEEAVRRIEGIKKITSRASERSEKITLELKEEKFL